MRWTEDRLRALRQERSTRTVRQMAEEQGITRQGMDQLLERAKQLPIIVGERFSRLTVMAEAAVPDCDRVRRAFRCLCDCGSTSTVRPEKLLSGRTKSCGCLRADAALKRAVRMRMSPERRSEIARMGARVSQGGSKNSASINIAGRRFGLLVALRYEKNRTWLCRCNCGVEKILHGAHLRGGRTKSCGCLRQISPKDRARVLAEAEADALDE